jgi:hypothetical protein
VKTRETEPIAFPDDAELAALRAWYAGLVARAAVARYLGDRKAPIESARGVLGRIRRALISYAASRHRADLAKVFSERSAGSVDTVARVIETLRNLPAPMPNIADEIDRWLPPRVVAALRAHGIRTLADLTGVGFCCVPGANRTSKGVDCRDTDQGHRAVGAVACAARIRRLAWTVPRPVGRLPAECVQRLRGDPVLAVAS